MTAKTSIIRDKDQNVNQIVGLDFFAIRANLQSWLKSQSQFSDYNFSGSNLSALLDLLAFNTHYMGFYLNAAISEAYLASSTQRTSAVAIAKELGYTPRSTRSATATIVVIVKANTGSPPFITIPAGTKFISSIGGASYTYVLVKSVLAYPNQLNPDLYTATLEITEGSLIGQTTLITADNLDDDIVLNQNIDTNTITVNVYPTSASDPVLYSAYSGSETLTSSSKVFFIEETDNLQYAIHFGDGILGQKLAVGNVVSVTYLVSSGEAANGANTFSLASVIPDGTLSTDSGYPGIITVVSATGGGPIEDVPSIKFTAPLSSQTQRRTVTPVDYQNLIKQKFSFVKSLAVWGGELNDPVALGYVFISIFPTDGPVLLSETQKYDIETYLAQHFSILNIRPVVVDPQYLFINVSVKLRVDPSASLSVASLESDVIETILGFNQTLINFNSYFRYSKLVTAIDATSPAITNSLASIQIERRLEISNQYAQDYAFKFFNEVQPNSFRTTNFTKTISSVSYTQAYLVDDGTGAIDLKYTDSFGVVYTLASDVGTINYATGDVILDDFYVDQVSATSSVENITFRAIPVAFDVYSVRNGILVIDRDSITVTAVPDRPSST